jgi:hypothetical protein
MRGGVVAVVASHGAARSVVADGQRRGCGPSSSATSGTALPGPGHRPAARRTPQRRDQLGHPWGEPLACRRADDVQHNLNPTNASGPKTGVRGAAAGAPTPDPTLPQVPCGQDCGAAPSSRTNSSRIVLVGPAGACNASRSPSSQPSVAPSSRPCTSPRSACPDRCSSTCRRTFCTERACLRVPVGRSRGSVARFALQDPAEPALAQRSTRTGRRTVRTADSRGEPPGRTCVPPPWGGTAPRSSPQEPCRCS